MTESHFHLQMFIPDPKLQGMCEMVAESLTANSTQPTVVADFSIPDTVNSAFNPDEIGQGSFDYRDIHTGEKVLFYKSPLDEYQKTEELKKGKITEVITYHGHLVLPGGINYYIGKLPPQGINLSYFALCNGRKRPYFGVREVLEFAGKTLGQIHSLGWTHNRFKVDQMILITQPKSSLVLYGNFGLQIDRDPEPRQNDIITFINSLVENNPECSHQEQGKHFLDIYHRNLSQ